jgi:hypothetical protein
MGARDHRRLYQDRVNAYLVTPLGATTPLEVAARLLELPRELVGLPVEPEDADIHRTRHWLETLAFHAAAPEATEVFYVGWVPAAWLSEPDPFRT